MGLESKSLVIIIILIIVIRFLMDKIMQKFFQIVDKFAKLFIHGQNNQKMINEKML